MISFSSARNSKDIPTMPGPAVFGGFFVGGPNGSRFRFPVDAALRVVLLIRRHEVRTEDARRVPS